MDKPAKASYADMSPTLPDDSYKLKLPSGGEANPNGLDCYISSSTHGDCTTYDYGNGASHQYLTLSRGSINDDPGNPPTYPYPAYRIQLKIYTNSAGRSTPKPISFNVVNRGITALRACQGYSLDAVYLTGDNEPITTDTQAVNGCTAYNLKSYPSSGFREITSNGVATGIFVGIIELTLPPGTHISKQASFHFTASNNARLGYKETITPAADPATGGSGDGWVNTYPTNAADGHKIKFRFSPPCETPVNSPFIIAWDDVDVANNTYQPSSKGPVSMTVYKEQRDGSGRTAIYSNTFSDPIEPSSQTFGTENYAPNRPYVYTVEFDNVYGGNGISFRYPYPSANFFLDCPTDIPAWKLDPGTEVRKQVDAYTPQWVNANTDEKQGDNVARAKTAFSAARFKHYVDEIDGQRAAQNGEHRWTIQFKTIRAGGAESAIFNKPAPLNNLSVSTPAGGNGILENDSRPNINSDGMKFLFRNATDTEYRNPVLGDQYCERVNNNTGSNVNGTVVNDPSTWKCVSLTNDPPCEEWSVRGISSVTGDGNPNSAWVGQNYNFNYNFSNNGPADNTSEIYFYHNFTPVPGPFPYAGYAHSQTLGSWAPTYGLNITAAQGGTTITDQMIYTPTTSAGADSCGIFGSNTLSGSVTVPYYFHLKPSTTPLTSTVQQGDPINISMTVELPDRDNEGNMEGDAATDDVYGGERHHTNSTASDWRIIEFKTTDISDTTNNKLQRNKSGGSGNCAEMATFNITGFAGCNDNLPGLTDSGTNTFALGTNKKPDNSNIEMKYNRTSQLDPIGTSICYVGVVSRPVEDDDNIGTVDRAFRYSNVSCTTVVKSPKVQFLNGDLTVGRHREGDGPAPCTPPIATAPIKATGAPSYAVTTFPPGNLYGSWVEYGAFATGAISGFGTAAYSEKGTNDELKLAFANKPSPGGFSYGNNCVRPFTIADESNTTNISAEAPSLKLGEYFTSLGHNTSASDKGGYIATSEDINIEPSAPPLDDNFNGFKGRDIVIKAKLGSGESCGGPGAGGNITIKSDITYATGGYGDINELPRVILLADCDIIINDNVKRVDAWLIARGAVKTCSASTGTKFFPERNVTHNDCKDQLKVNGAVQSKRLLLWRTHGIDFEGANALTASEPAEVFDLRPDQLLATYARGNNAGKPTTVYQTEVPPRY